MKLVTALSVLVGSLLVAGQVQAERSSTRLTPEKTSEQRYSFTIQVERLNEIEAGDFFEFRVTITPKDAQATRLPHRSGKLKILNGMEFVSSCDVQSTGRDAELLFSFRVSEKYAEKSTFTFAETLEHPAGGHGSYYWFYLQDFVELK